MKYIKYIGTGLIIALTITGIFVIIVALIELIVNNISSFKWVLAGILLLIVSYFLGKSWHEKS